MKDNGSSSERFIEDPQVYLTHWIHDKVKDWPKGFYSAMGDVPLSRLHSVAGVMLRPGGISKINQQEMETDAKQIFSPLYEFVLVQREMEFSIFHLSYKTGNVFL
jgi:hypothetical protein